MHGVACVVIGLQEGDLISRHRQSLSDAPTGAIHGSRPGDTEPPCGGCQSLFRVPALQRGCVRNGLHNQPALVSLTHKSILPLSTPVGSQRSAQCLRDSSMAAAPTYSAEVVPARAARRSFWVLLAGGAAGVASRTLTAPIDRARIICAANGVTVRTAVQTIRHQGARPLRLDLEMFK